MCVCVRACMTVDWLIVNITCVLLHMQTEEEEEKGGGEKKEDEYERDSSDEEVRSVLLCSFMFFMSSLMFYILLSVGSTSFYQFTGVLHGSPQCSDGSLTFFVTQ